jgi:hypothetical protein
MAKEPVLGLIGFLKFFRNRRAEQSRGVPFGGKFESGLARHSREAKDDLWYA